MLKIFQTAKDCLLLNDPEKKCQAVFNFQHLFNAENNDFSKLENVDAITLPGRPKFPKLVPPQQVPRRKISTQEGRVALIHAITHIEFNAINLALDAMLRFQAMPIDYYKDWMQVAFEEAQHFAHNGLWEMAMKTSSSVIARMALVPRVLEARGLDVTPGMMQRLSNVGDHETAAILKVIFEQEIGHVAIGSRWFAYACEQEGKDPESTFQYLLKEYMSGELRGPFELEARRQAGFSQAELAALQNT